MADTYQVLDAYKTIQVLSAQQVVDVEYVTISTFPTGIQLSYAMPLEVWKNGPPYTVFDLMAALLENLVTNYHVVAGSAVQDIDKNGLLTDYCDLIVEYDRSATGQPPLQGTVSIPVSLIYLEATDPEIANAEQVTPPGALCEAEYQRLAALAGG
jgi:hypothetical protein